MSDDSLTECPECGGSVRRVIHPVGVVFKGSGWYITDSRKPAPSENGASDKAAGKTDGGEAKEPAAAKAEKTTDNGKEPVSKTAKSAKTVAKAATD